MEDDFDLANGNAVPPEMPETEHIDLADELAVETPRIERPADIELPPLPEPGDEADPSGDEAEPLRSRGFFRGQARMWVTAFDGIQRTTFQHFVYPRTMLQPDDEAVVDDWMERVRRANKNRDPEPALTDEHPAFQAMERLREFQRKCKELGFSGEEKETLIKPLADVLEKHQARQLSPEWALIVAVMLVMLPRLEPCFPSIFKAFK